MRHPSESKPPRRPILIGLGVKLCARGGFSGRSILAAVILAGGFAGCGPATELPGPKPDGREWKCAIAPDSVPEYSHSIACGDDFEALASHPLNASIPGALAAKTVIDRADGNRLYFPDTRKYELHYDFVSKNLSGNGKPLVPSVSQFSLTEYYTPDRRFILGTLEHYPALGIWAWEMTPSDNAGADLIALAYAEIAAGCFCGKDLYFHATSLAMEAEALNLPASVKVLPSSRLHEALAYHPLSNAAGIGKVVFATAEGLRNRAGKGYPDSRRILVLDSAPAELPAAAGIITQALQAPLSPFNVLAREHGIPNMGLRGALSDSALRALEGKWAKLTVEPFGYSVTEATEAEAEAWREAHKPAAAAVPGMDTVAEELRDAEGILDPAVGALEEALRKAIPAYGGLAANYSALARMDTGAVRFERGLGIPVRYYHQHMRQNGLYDSVDRMLADPAFQADPAERGRRLGTLREAILSAPVDAAFLGLLDAKLDEAFPGVGRFRFRASSNAGGLDGFTGAGLYGSAVGGRNDPSEPLRKALLEVWAGLWGFRAFEERTVRDIDHKNAGMAVLVQPAGTAPAAEGSALTVNPYDLLGYEPGFYVNVKTGGASEADWGLAGPTDQFVYHYLVPGQPIVMLARSDTSSAGSTVLTLAQSNALGKALLEIYLAFQPVYGKNRADWYGMGVDFRLARKAGDADDAKPVILIDRAGPYRDWGHW